MSYTPTEWNTGDIVTAEKLNKLENGVAGGSGDGNFIVNILFDETTHGATLDKTWQEIKDATDAGKLVLAYSNGGIDGMTFLFLIVAIEEYEITILNVLDKSDIPFTANDANDYPCYTQPK